MFDPWVTFISTFSGEFFTKRERWDDEPTIYSTCVWRIRDPSDGAVEYDVLLVLCNPPDPRGFRIFQRRKSFVPSCTPSPTLRRERCRVNSSTWMKYIFRGGRDVLTLTLKMVTDYSTRYPLVCVIHPALRVTRAKVVHVLLPFTQLLWVFDVVDKELARRRVHSARRDGKFATSTGRGGVCCEANSRQVYSFLRFSSFFFMRE
jgi:hypothetical protein